MKKPLAPIGGRATLLALLAAISLGSAGLQGKERKEEVPGNGPTSQLFQILDKSHDGKLKDFCILADTFKNPDQPQQELMHVIRVDYDQSKAFGKLLIHVRSVDKPQPEQLKVYTPADIYKFGQYDAEKFVKSTLGPLGQPGDLYLHTRGDMPLTSAPITDQIRGEYDTFLTQYLIPALEKK